MWTVQDATTLLVYLVFCYWQPMSNMSSMYNKGWYEERRKKMTCAPPAYLFGAVWAVLFALIAVSGYLYFGRTDSASSAHFLAGYILYVANVVLTKLWTPIFFDKSTKRMGLALFIALLITATAVTLLVLMALDQQFVAVGLYSVYVAWSAFAVYLNYKFYSVNGNEKPVKKKKKVVKARLPVRGSYNTRERIPSEKPVKLDIIL